MRNVLVLGASGIVGQTLRYFVLDGVNFIFCRSGRLSHYDPNGREDGLHVTADLTIEEDFDLLFNYFDPIVVVNMAGINNVDKVEKDSEKAYAINVEAAEKVAKECASRNIGLIHLSSQAVLGGDYPFYSAHSELIRKPEEPVNRYGRQKLDAEVRVSVAHPRTVIIRPTFVVGVRPFPWIGRTNPVEHMIVDKELKQVDDRKFSVVFAEELAREISKQIAILLRKEESSTGTLLYVGGLESVTRHSLAVEVAKHRTPKPKIEAVAHSSFQNCAERAMNTTYGPGAVGSTDFEAGVESVVKSSHGFNDLFSPDEFIKEISLFLGVHRDKAASRFAEGFHYNHAKVAEDFKLHVNAYEENQLLDWYKLTDTYIWELSAFHCDSRFNYVGMTKGIYEAIQNSKYGERPFRKVLVLGDGVGTLSGYLCQRGVVVYYHDLRDSLTAKFADFRFQRRGLGVNYCFGDSHSFTPSLSGAYDVIIAMDFMEHLPNVREWVQACWGVLRPGGALMARNAFGQGSGLEGSIPCHLPCNDGMEDKWDATVKEFGFEHVANEWYFKPIKVK